MLVCLRFHAMAILGGFLRFILASSHTDHPSPGPQLFAHFEFNRFVNKKRKSDRRINFYFIRKNLANKIKTRKIEYFFIHNFILFSAVRWMTIWGGKKNVVNGIRIKKYYTYLVKFATDWKSCTIINRFH